MPQRAPDAGYDHDPSDHATAWPTAPANPATSPIGASPARRPAPPHAAQNRLAWLARSEAHLAPVPSPRAGPGSWTATGAGDLHLRDVPFVPQERLLCGPASIEMALRHGGARGVYARDFRPLVREDEGGIRTDELTAAVAELGWRVRAGASDPEALRSDLAAGRPVTVLLVEGPERYHYVLVVGWTAEAVIVHDPARAPDLRIPVGDFLDRWSGAGHWALVALAPPRPAAEIAAAEPTAVDDAPAHPLLLEASALFRASRWDAAAAAALAATLADPDDPRAWRVLATSRYLAGDGSGALDAWNHLGGPVLDVVSVTGLRRTRQPAAHALLGLTPGQPLEAGALARARRRIALLPSASATSVGYRAVSGGLAEVDVTAVEPALLPRGPGGIVRVLLPAAVRSELELRAPGITGGGEVAALHLRWSEARPAVAGMVAAPGAFGAPGVTRLEIAWERERHAGATGSADAAAHVETRTAARLSLTDWASGWLRWEVSAGLDRWSGAGRTGVLGAAVELSPSGGAGGATVIGTVEGAAGSGSGAPTYLSWSAEGSAEFMRAVSGWGMRVRTLAAGTNPGAPRMVWPGAGVGRARTGLLRAHPLEEGGVLAGPTLGRGLLNVSAEVERTLAALPLAEFGVALFVDAARITGRAPESTPGGAPLRSHFLDGGVGLRVTLPHGRLRADAAWGVDATQALSLGWETTRRSWRR